MDGPLGNPRKTPRDDLTTTSEESSPKLLPSTAEYETSDSESAKKRSAKEKTSRDRKAEKEEAAGSIEPTPRIRPAPKTAKAKLTPTQTRDALKKRMVAVKSCSKVF